MKIRKIKLYTKGTNRDEFGNPYAAYRMIIYLQHCSFSSHIELIKSATGFDSGEYGCYKLAMQGFKEAFGKDLSKYNVEQIHEQFCPSQLNRLEHPENWRVEI